MTKKIKENFINFSMATLFIIALMILTMSCGDNHTVTQYSVKKVNAKKNFGHEWLPLNPTTYRIGDNVVVSETAGFLHKYTNCKTLSKKNWECSYDDGSGSFGYRNGVFWELPKWKGIKNVSRLEYNIIRCKWALASEGKIWGTSRCIFGWR